LQATNAYDSNPDVNEDMKMFEMLGLNPQSIYKVSQPATVEAVDSQFVPLGENQNGLAS
jgi:biotin synthase